MTITLIIISCACFAFSFIEVLHIPKKVDQLDVKPFNCVYCLAGWSSFFVCILAGYYFESILVIWIAAVAGLILDNAVKRYL